MIYTYSARPIHVSVHQWGDITKWRHSDSSSDLTDPTSVACVPWDVSQREWMGFFYARIVTLGANILEVWQN